MGLKKTSAKVPVHCFTCVPGCSFSAFLLDAMPTRGHAVTIIVEEGTDNTLTFDDEVCPYNFIVIAGHRVMYCDTKFLEGDTGRHIAQATEALANDSKQLGMPCQSGVGGVFREQTISLTDRPLIPGPHVCEVM